MNLEEALVVVREKIRHEGTAPARRGPCRHLNKQS
jgi:hypothetical protein